MKKKLNEEKQIQADETKDTSKKTMSEEEFDVYIEKIMNNDETVKPEEKKEQKSELGELKDELKKLINSLSAISQNMAYIPSTKKTSAEEPKDIQKAKMLQAILAERKRQDAMRKHIFAQAEDLKKTFSSSFHYTNLFYYNFLFFFPRYIFNFFNSRFFNFFWNYIFNFLQFSHRFINIFFIIKYVF